MKFLCVRSRALQVSVAYSTKYCLNIHVQVNCRPYIFTIANVNAVEQSIYVLLKKKNRNVKTNSRFLESVIVKTESTFTYTSI